MEALITTGLTVAYTVAGVVAILSGPTVLFAFLTGVVLSGLTMAFLSSSRVF
jgi:hypothetical protein